MKKEIIEAVQIILMILIIIFGLFILYQIILKIFGGSWETENLIIGLLMINISLTFALSISLTKLRSDHNYLLNQFKNLASDFKLNRSK